MEERASVVLTRHERQSAWAPSNERQGIALPLHRLHPMQELLGSLCVRSRSHGKRRAFHYTCSTHYLRGPERCGESMLIPIEDLDRDILETLEQDILNPAIIAKAIEKAMRELQATEHGDPDARRDTLRNELMHVETELARLTTAIATGGSLDTLLSAMKDREDRQKRLRVELTTLDGPSFDEIGHDRVKDELLCIR